MFASPLQRLLPMDKSVFSGVCGQDLATAAVAVAFKKNLNAAKPLVEQSKRLGGNIWP